MLFLLLCLLAAAGAPQGEHDGGAIIGLTYALEPVDGTGQYCRNATDCWAAMKTVNRNPRVDWVAIQVPKD